MGNLTASSEEKEAIGDSVPEVKTILRTSSLMSPKQTVAKFDWEIYSDYQFNRQDKTYLQSLSKLYLSDF